MQKNGLFIKLLSFRKKNFLSTTKFNEQLKLNQISTKRKDIATQQK